MTIDEALDTGVGLIQQGRLADAEKCFVAVLQVSPNHPEAHHFMGIALGQAGEYVGAIEAIGRAIALSPNEANFYSNLGHYQRLAGRTVEAVASLRRALELKPGFVDALNNLGNALKDQSETAEAIACYQAVLAQQPRHMEALNNLGNALAAAGQLEEAIAALNAALVLNPGNAEIHNNLGNVWKLQNNLREAEKAYRAAIVLRPGFGMAHSNLGVVLHEMRREDEAIASFHDAMVADPKLPDAPMNLGNVHKCRGDVAGALACYENATAMSPDFLPAHDNVLYTRHFSPAMDGAGLAEAHRKWNLAHVRPLRGWIRPRELRGNRGGRLRIGYVSGDLRDHVVGRNVLPLFRHHDHRVFEIFCYSNAVRHDAMEDEFKACADHWRDITALSDEAAAELIRRDAIDILVDLSLHMAGNRLMIFARQPAPMQMTFAGYPGSTGMETMDYRISDPWLDPPELPNQGHYAEETLRVANSFWCFEPRPEDALPARGEFPAANPEAIRFGCLNNICKINESITMPWAEILRALPGSRLTLLKEEAQNPAMILNQLARQGIPPGRIDFFERRPRRDYLALFQNIDVCLDTVPYNGHSTSLDSLWMGVPVVTLVGRTVVGRAGFSQMMNLGLPELITYSTREYVERALELAGNSARLRGYHTTLRARMRDSVLMDARGFARSIEAAYRGTIPPA